MPRPAPCFIAPQIKPTSQFQQYLTGLHFVQFRHWTLRWLFFGLGLLGCLLIATGFLFWVESRRKAHAAAGKVAGLRLVEGLAAGSTAGLVVATLAFFVANRVLPSGATWLGAARYELEIWTFFAVWVLAFAHGWLRRGSVAWSEQCWAAAGLSVLAVVLNALTTGDHVPRALAGGKLAVAGMDLVLLAAAAAAAVTAWRLHWRRLSAAPERRHLHHPLEGQVP